MSKTLPREDHSHGKSSSITLPHKMFPTLRISNSISNSLADIKAYRPWGQSVWPVGSTCDVLEETIQLEIVVTTCKATYCTTSACRGAESWLGFGGDMPGVCNYIRLLSCAWAYIISARWAETQEGLLNYLEPEAPISSALLNSPCC